MTFYTKDLDNNQKQLTDLLGKTAAYSNSTKQVRDRAVNQIPKLYQQIEHQLIELRGKIKRQGIGFNQEDESQYLRLLHDRQVIDQIYGMNLPKIPHSLQKMIDYGEFLLGLCDGGRSLHKSPTLKTEIENTGNLLINSGVVQLGNQLIRRINENS